MAKNLKQGETVYKVETVHSEHETFVCRGLVEELGAHGICKVMWLAPDCCFVRISEFQYACDLSKTRKGAINKYLRRVRLNLEAQSAELGET